MTDPAPAPFIENAALRRRADDLDALVRGGEEHRRDELMKTLEALARDDHGLEWRYIPGGVFRMGSDEGDDDERPVRDVWVDGFFMSATPLGGQEYERLTASVPEKDLGRFNPRHSRKLRFHYAQGDGGSPHEAKPRVATSYEEGLELAEHLSAAGLAVDLPTEAEWERAARGLLHGARYPWGDEEPTDARCDFDSLDEPQVKRSRSLPPNDYGLYAMSGGVAEWCRDHYDARFYEDGERDNPVCVLPAEVLEALGAPEYVLRGGSWADCAEACRVSFRNSSRSEYLRGEHLAGIFTPTIGVRLVLRVR